MSESTVLDDYELINCLATGNSTQVWEVRQKSSGQSYAMKLLLPESFSDPEQKKALKNEAAIGKQFEHPNLIRIFDVVVAKKHGYFIMEYFRSTNLKQMLRSERPAVQARAKKILEAVAQALAHMHEKNYVHKDLKPENILATKGSEVKLIDFSLASRPSGALTKLMGGSKNAIIQGTRTYLAPELIRRKPLTFAADMYSLGITFFEIATGRPPFIHGNPNELLMAHVRDMPDKPSSYNPNITPEADALILRMLSKKPEQRPASMMDLAAELRNLKIFKDDPEEYARGQASAAQSKYDESLDARLDSRADAARDKSAPSAAPRAKPKIVTTSADAKPAAAKVAAPAAVAAQPGAPAPPPVYPPPQYPGGAFPPGYPPQMPYYPGMPQPGMPPGMAPPGWPGYPPGQPLPPGYPYPPGFGSPPATMPGAPPSSAPAPAPAAAPPTPSAAPVPAAAPQQPTEEDEADLPLMTELPDVL